MTAEQVLMARVEMVENASIEPAPSRKIVLPPEVVAVGLTRRELDVLRLLAEGLTNAQIAKCLVLSTVTVNSYLRSIYSKLGVHSRTEAAVKFLQK